MVRDVPRILSIVQQRAVFAWLAFLVPALAIFGHALAPGKAFFKGQDLGIVFALALSGLVILTWIPYREGRRASRLVLITLLTLLLAWLAQVIRIQLDGSLFNISTFCLPLLIVLLLMKIPSITDVRIAGLCLMYGIAIIALVSIPLGLLGWMPNGFEGADNAECRSAVFCDLLGHLNRWSGPFGSVNYAAPIGALLIVFGAAQQRRHAWFLIATGVLIMFLSQGRSAAFAAIAGVAIVILWGARVSAAPNRRTIRTVAIAALAALAVIYVFVFDPTINGRVPYWQEFLTMWRNQPWTGIGTSGVNDYMNSHGGTATVSHAHSVLIDQLVRWGPLLALLSVAVFVLVVITSARAVRWAGPGPIAVAIAVVLSGLVETVHDWTYWSAYVALLVWAVLASVEREPEQPAMVSSAG